MLCVGSTAGIAAMLCARRSPRWNDGIAGWRVLTDLYGRHRVLEYDLTSIAATEQDDLLVIGMNRSDEPDAIDQKYIDQYLIFDQAIQEGFLFAVGLVHFLEPFR